MCGPTVIGCLLVTEETFQEMKPFMGGGDMIETVTFEGSTYQTNEHRFEAGTPRIAEAIGWNAALNYLANIDLVEQHKRLLTIARHVAKELRTLGMTVYGRHDDEDSSVVSFLHPTLHSEDFAHLPRRSWCCSSNWTPLRSTTLESTWNQRHGTCFLLHLQHHAGCGRILDPCACNFGAVCMAILNILQS